jgi:hypothetical protein
MKYLYPLFTCDRQVEVTAECSQWGENRWHDSVNFLLVHETLRSGELHFSFIANNNALQCAVNVMWPFSAPGNLFKFLPHQAAPVIRGKPAKKNRYKIAC